MQESDGRVSERGGAEDWRGSRASLCLEGAVDGDVRGRDAYSGF